MYHHHHFFSIICKAVFRRKGYTR